MPSATWQLATSDVTLARATHYYKKNVLLLYFVAFACMQLTQAGPVGRVPDINTSTSVCNAKFALAGCLDDERHQDSDGPPSYSRTNQKSRCNNEYASRI